MSNELDQKYQLPEEINADLTIKYNIPVRLVVVVGVMWLVSNNTVGMIYPPFAIAWYIWNILIGFILCIPSKQNHKKMLGYSLMVYLTKNHGEYKSIDNPAKYEDMKVSEKDETPDSEYHEY